MINIGEGGFFVGSRSIYVFLYYEREREREREIGLSATNIYL